jgi:hypothetical protein
MPANDETAHSWSRFSERVGVISWTSFLAACLETMVFFAYFDPMMLDGLETTPTWLALRPAAYAAGFFFFWAFTFVSSTLTAYMLDSGRNAAPSSAESHQ